MDDKTRCDEIEELTPEEEAMLDKVWDELGEDDDE